MSYIERIWCGFLKWQVHYKFNRSKIQHYQILILTFFFKLRKFFRKKYATLWYELDKWIESFFLLLKMTLQILNAYSASGE